MTRKEILRNKYAIIKNAYQDTQLAKKGSFWSWSKIERELGIKKPSQTRFKKGYDLKSYSKSTQYHKQSQLKKVREMKEMAFTPKALRQYKRKSYNKIAENTRDFVIDDGKHTIYYPDDKDERYDTWKFWSIRNENNMPKAIRSVATQINNKYNKIINHKTGEKETNLHRENHRYGFGVMYFMYVNEKKLEDAIKIIEPNDNEIRQYVYVTKN